MTKDEIERNATKRIQIKTNNIKKNENQIQCKNNWNKLLGMKLKIKFN